MKKKENTPTTRTDELSPDKVDGLLRILKERFEKHPERHKNLQWADIQGRLEDTPEKLQSLNDMEDTGGEPDVIGQDIETGAYLFVDCSPETPRGRRSVCYDPDALESRKQHKPAHSAIGMAAEMGIELLDEERYRHLQQFGVFDTKTSSWLKTPESIRDRGGAIFGDWRYGQVFIYHNGAESYYAARGFRGVLRV